MRGLVGVILAGRGGGLSAPRAPRGFFCREDEGFGQKAGRFGPEIRGWACWRC